MASLIFRQRGMQEKPEQELRQVYLLDGNLLSISEIPIFHMLSLGNVPFIFVAQIINDTCIGMRCPPSPLSCLRESL